jgi:membrane fusion protein, adhesin transport system
MTHARVLSVEPMPTSFSRTLRAVEGETLPRSLGGLLPAGILLLLWVFWFFLAHIPIYVASERAWISAKREPVSLSAPVAGQVEAIYLELGSEVRAGQLLVELNATEQRALLQESRARQSALHAEIQKIRNQLESLRQSLASKRLATSGTLREAEARVTETESAAVVAEREAERIEALKSVGLVSDSEAQSARGVAEQRRAAARSARSAVERLDWGERIAGTDRSAAIAELERELTHLAGEQAASAANIARLQNELALRRVTSPVAGRIGRTAAIQIGSVIAAGTSLGTIVPDGLVKLVADFKPAEASGKIRVGQTARMRLSGFPAVRFGALSARVWRVGEELSDDHLRIELLSEPNRTINVPLIHGVPGIIEVEIERVTPAEMVLRAVGKALDSPGTSSS